MARIVRLPYAGSREPEQQLRPARRPIVNIRRRINGTVTILALALALSVLLPAADVASAASRPAAHWGTFTKVATGNSCLSMARKALFDQGYETQNAGYMVMGFSNTVAVSVVCVPRQQNTWVAVNAYSDDTRAAELARNRVREQIVRMVMID
jgi:hypothetical protein